jgi:hypothetical protein
VAIEQLCLFAELKLPRDASFDDRVGDCDQPACDCDDDELVGLTAFFQTFCDRFENWIMAGSGERGLEQNTSQRSSTARNRSPPSHCPAVVWDWCQASHGTGFA